MVARTFSPGIPMSDESQHRGGLDYMPCRYGTSKLLFRGPRRRLDGDYVAVIGGTETYGRFLPRPWPVLLEEASGLPVVNLGQINAGIGTFAADAAVPGICAAARLTVVQLAGAQLLSNAFYRVNPVRNDRFLAAEPLLQRLAHRFDFDDIVFVRQLLWALAEQAPAVFPLVVEDLKNAWVAQMQSLLARIGPEVVLLWIEGHPAANRDGLGLDPLFVDAAMVTSLRPLVREVVRVAPSATSRAAGTAGMVFPAFDAALAGELPGVLAQGEIASALLRALRPHLRSQGQ